MTATGSTPTLGRDALACLALAAAWCVTALVVGIHGEFPVSDDWAYARSVYGVLETGRFERLYWTYAPILTNLGIGVSVTSLLGFSFEALRLSNLILGLFGTLGCYALCRAIGVGVGAAALGAALYGWNPIHLALSYSFMTDVAFAALCTWSLVCLVKCLREGRPDFRWLLAGAVIGVAAVLSRQTGAAIGLALAAAFASIFVRNTRTALRAGLPAAALVGLFFLVDTESFIVKTLVWYVEATLLSINLPYRLLVNGTTAALYLGVFLAPLTLLAFSRASKGWQRGAVVVVCALLLGVLLLVGSDLPPGLDWVRDFGLGPILIAGNAPAGLPAGAWWLILILGGLSAGGVAVLLAGQCAQAWSQPRERAQCVLLFGFPLIMLGILGGRTPFFDRYLVPAMPPVIALLLTLRLPAAGTWRSAVAVAVTLVLALFGVAGTRDYLEHHRARSRLLAQLVAADVSPARIDGGNEFAGWHNFHVHRRLFLSRGGRRWIVDDEYIVGFDGPHPGYHEIAAREYATLLSGRLRLVTLHRDAADTHDHPPPLGIGSSALAYDPARIGIGTPQPLETR